MNYKVAYDALDSMCNSVSTQTSAWQEELGKVAKRLQVLQDTGNMSGAAADGIKSYLGTVHSTLLSLIYNLLSLHMTNCYTYKSDYQLNVDTGLHTVIHKTELKEYKCDVKSTQKKAVDIEEAVAYVLSGIKDIFTVSYTDVTEVDKKHGKVVTLITDLDEAIVALEDKHYQNDFVNTAEMIAALKTVINEQLGKTRSFRTNFEVQSLGTPSWQGLLTASTNVTGEIEAKDQLLKEALQNEKDRIEAFEQEKEDREWIKWVSVGIAVVGSVVLIAVTAGGATPLVCAGVGAAVGVTTAAADNFADNYIENGSLTEGMNWSDFGKDCLIGGVTGAISGYMGATSVGSAVKQPIDKAIQSAAGSLLEKGAEGLINTTWDVGEALIAGKPGDEILSIVQENTAEMMKNMVLDGATGFVGGFVSGHFDVEPGKKGFWKKLGEDTIENGATALTENGVESVWDIGSAILDPNSSKDISTVLKEEACDFVGGVGEDFVKGEIEAVAGGLNDVYKKGHKDQSKVSEIFGDIMADTVGGTAGAFAGGAVEQRAEIAFGEREGYDFKEIWDDEMDGGRIFVKKAGVSAGEHVLDAVHEDESFGNKLKQKDYDKDGKVDVVVFDKYMVLKEDYEAARAVAGKGAYKDMTAQDILGLPKNAKISEKNMEVREIAISRLEKSEYEGRKETNVTRIDYKSDKKKLYDKE